MKIRILVAVSGDKVPGPVAYGAVLMDKATGDVLDELSACCRIATLSWLGIAPLLWR